MMLGPLCRSLTNLRHVRNFGARCMSTTSFKDISIDLNTESKVAVLSMQKKPVNSLSLENLSEIRTALDQLDSDKNCHGLILTSSVPRIFSAGLDILEMYQPQQERLRNFWSTLQDVWLKLYGSRLVTIAAINGNSPAGGCLLATSCDYRIMAEGNYTIGLNETKLGIVAPFWFQDTFINTIGHREAEKSLMVGHMFSTSEALQKGLVDKLVPEAEVLDAAKGEMAQWLQVPGMARAITKQQMRRATLAKLEKTKEADIQQFVDFCNTPLVQKTLGIYMENLKKRSQAKN